MIAARSLNEAHSPAEVRQLARRGDLTTPTAGLAPGFAQANLVILPRDLAYDFLLFCQRNPKPCPLLEVTDVGSPEPRRLAPGADLRTDLPRYRIYHQGDLVGEPTEIVDLWDDRLVGFLLGCSFTFEAPMVDAGIPIRHLTGGRNVPMYRTHRACVPAGVFDGPLVVSMRAVPATQVAEAVTISARFPGVHGAPVHVGDPAGLGITDLSRPDWGDPPIVEPGDVPVFWACGVTPQAVAMSTRPELMITHAPGHMFVTDLPISGLAAW
ncbi:MAG TPA: putative hydro-lyase [Thermomicrobiaceae bacterium]|nr:putative hydro-lyase [Thermomicrobiaceae bacterium]